MLRLLSCCLLLALLAAVPAVAAPQTDTRADETCEQGNNCNLPDCLCASLKHPGDIALEDVPQFVVLTFDDAIASTSGDFYFKFKDFLNPNQCRITMTFFLTHLWTDYTTVNELHRLGHEISLHSVTHKNDMIGYWLNGNESVWMQEMDDMRTIVAKNAKIPEEDLKGWRAPFLELGGDEMYGAMHQLGLQYDSSWTTLKYTNWFEEQLPGLWPYTLDFPSPQDCLVGRCPSGQYPGVWVMPMLDLIDNKDQPCSMLDNCQSADEELLTDASAVEEFLKRNFYINYNANKTPFGIYMHLPWFYQGTLNNTDARQEGYTNFLLWLATLDDVFVVSLDRVLAWMKNPKKISEIDQVSEINCPSSDPITNCPTVNTYRYTSEHNIPPELSEVYMGTCDSPQSEYFPWLYNPYGLEDIPIPPGFA